MITDRRNDFISKISNKNGTLLAIDFGKKNVGIAISNPQKTIAMPLTICDNNEKLLLNIIEIINTNNCIGIIMGWPVNMANKAVHPIGNEILMLCGNIFKATGLPILLLDESLSTKDALDNAYELQTRQGKKFIKKLTKQDDHLAASVILSRFIENLKI